MGMIIFIVLQAAFHYQNEGPPHGGDPMSIANVRAVTNFIEKNMYEARRKSDWMNYCRHLLLRDLVSQARLISYFGLFLKFLLLYF